MKDITLNNFETEIGGAEAAVIEFYSPTCAHCKKQEKALSEIAEAYGDKASFGKSNIADEPDLAARFDVTAVPTILLVKNGEIKDKLVGFTHKLVIEDKLSRL